MIRHCVSNGTRRILQKTVGRSSHRRISSSSIIRSNGCHPAVVPLSTLSPTSSFQRFDINTKSLVYRCKSSVAASVEDDGSYDDVQTMLRKYRRKGVRNVAIVAHVDHGKTTLVDQLLKVSSSANRNDDNNDNNDGASSDTDRLLDSGDLEKERGITITSKVTRCYHKQPNEGNSDVNIINVVDTPGHADFCGEVDRVLSLVDGIVLVVDAGEGPMAQTKYVLSRALQAGLTPLVVLNKIDRNDALASAESGETESQLLDLFDALDATETQMDYVTLYASARNGWITDDIDVAKEMAEDINHKHNIDQDVSMKLLLDRIMEVIPEPTVLSYNDGCNAEDSEGTPDVCDGEDFVDDKFSLAAVTVGYDNFLGRTCTGRIYSGSVGLQDELVVLKRRANDNDDTTSEMANDTAAEVSNSISSTLAGMFVNRGISRTPFGQEGNESDSSNTSARAYAGDIVTLAGVPDDIAVGDTVTGAANPVAHPIETPPLAPPTLSMEFGANNGPLSGREGSVLTSSKIRDRLTAETDNNVTINVERSPTDADKSVVFARGELQLGILIEQMRREGFEPAAAAPQSAAARAKERVA